MEGAAKAHVDSHVVVMCKEYAQILSAVHHNKNSPLKDLVYKNSHKGNRFIAWAGETKENYEYLVSLWSAVHDEFMHRFGKGHKSFLDLYGYLSFTPDSLSPLGITTPAFPDDSKISKPTSFEDAVEKYREYYRLRKRALFKWSKRDKPQWLNKKKKPLK